MEIKVYLDMKNIGVSPDLRGICILLKSVGTSSVYIDEESLGIEEVCELFKEYEIEPLKLEPSGEPYYLGRSLDQVMKLVKEYHKSLEHEEDEFNFKRYTGRVPSESYVEGVRKLLKRKGRQQ